MSPNVQAAIVLGTIGIICGLCGDRANTKGLDGSGWGILAFFFLLSSCSAATFD